MLGQQERVADEAEREQEKQGLRGGRKAGPLRREDGWASEKGRLRFGLGLGLVETAISVMVMVMVRVRATLQT